MLTSSFLSPPDRPSLPPPLLLLPPLCVSPSPLLPPPPLLPLLLLLFKPATLGTDSARMCVTISSAVQKAGTSVVAVILNEARPMPLLELLGAPLEVPLLAPSNEVDTKRSPSSELKKPYCNSESGCQNAVLNANIRQNQVVKCKASTTENYAR